ncbi:DUF3817 domain-containing protein [Clavibacter michiganensis]|uniref:DUF3817 domain-containing protein n=1 Tax=Clavibacter michiganensis TaxID=28447 RepID=UPI0026DB6A14|nr:DUF3817 domain-containing protein [Clavibacter michiganensis]MDO4047519.1 DUF3817 domain-containing protein [Clavibacter michiganensis]
MTNAPHPDAAPPAEPGARPGGSAVSPATAGSAPATGFAALVRGTRDRSDRPSRLGRLFAVVAIVEAITWTGLLVGMFLKYVTETTELGVYVFGRLHGVAFVLYVIVTAVAAIRLRWGWKPALLAGVAAIPPLATLPLEVGLRRRGYLRQPADAVDGSAPAGAAPGGATSRG